jgi:ASC-1-like (ASCH) protein
MKHYTLRFRKADEEIYLALRRGIKKVETRAATARYRNIEKGDKVTFVCGAERFERRVKQASHFKDVDAMLLRYPIRHIMPRVKTRKRMKEQYAAFPGYAEKIRLFGIVALELR